MQKPSSASASGSDRDRVARALYHDRTASDAGHRAETNTRFGQHDLSAALADALALGAGDSVFDVGCGIGKHLEALGARVGEAGRCVGLDFARDAVALATERGFGGVVADGVALPLASGTGNGICCAYAVYYFSDLEAAVREWHRVLKPGGRIVVAGPAADTNAELYDFHLEATGAEPSDADRMALGYVSEQVSRVAKAVGFREVTTETFENRITYPTADDFVAYWAATSLFLRTVPEPKRDEAVRGAHDIVSRRDGEMFITKRTTVLSAERAA